MWVIENYRTVNKNNCLHPDGQVAIFASHTQAVEFFDSNVKARLTVRAASIMSVDRTNEEERMRAVFKYADTSEEILSLHPADFMDR